MSGDPALVGWRYTIGNNLEINRQNKTTSIIYTKMEEWYNNISIKNKTYIDGNTIYCNDKKLLMVNIMKVVVLILQHEQK